MLISRVGAGVGTFVWGDRFESIGDGGFEGVNGSCRLAQKGFDLDEGLLDWGEVRGVWRQEQQGCACGLDDIACAFDLIGGLFCSRRRFCREKSAFPDRAWAATKPRPHNSPSHLRGPAHWHALCFFE